MILQAIQELIPVSEVHLIWSERHEPERRLLIDQFPEAKHYEPLWKQGVSSRHRDITSKGLLGAGQVSLSLTHIMILNNLTDGYNLILESDACINVDKLHTLNGFPNYDVAWLDYQTVNEFRTGRPFTPECKWSVPIMPLRTHALLIHSRAAEKLLSRMTILNKPYDWELKDAVRGLKWGGHRGAFGWIDYGKSNIMNNGIKV